MIALSFTARRLIHALVIVVVSTLAARTHADDLILISPHWEGVKREVEVGFGEYYRKRNGRDVELRWLDVGGTSDILKYIRSEFRSKPDGIDVDVLFGGGTDPFIELAQTEVLAPHKLPGAQLSPIPSELGGIPLYDPEYKWYAAGMSTFGILCNRKVIERAGLSVPREWSDLSLPSYYGWVSTADPRKSGSMHLMYEVVLSAYGWERGWEILTGITRNAISFSATASQVGKDVAQGEVACGMAIDSYAGELLRRYGREHLEFVVPPGLSPVTGDAVAILRGAPHRKAAEQFVEYLLSEEGQTVIFAKLGEPGGPRRFEIGKLTVLPQLYGKVRSAAPINDNPFLWRFSFRYDAQQSGNRWGVINELIGTFLIDHHRAIREFGQLPTGAPVTQQEVDAIVASGQWSKDPLYRRQFANRWMETARNRYATGSGSGLLRSLLPGMIFLVFLAAPLVRGRRSPASIPASFHHPR